MKRAWLLLMRLALRRVLPWPLLACVLVALVLVALPGASMPEAVVVEAESLARMLARARVWIATGTMVALVCVPRAALAGAEARASEGDLLSASALPRWIEVTATWFGTLCGGLLLLCLGALAAEFAAGGNRAAWSRTVQLENPTLSLVQDREARWDLPSSPAFQAAAGDPRALLALDAVALPDAGPATILSAYVDAEQRPGPQEQRLLSGRGHLRLALGEGERRSLVVQRDDRGALAVIPKGTLALLSPTPWGERSASARLWIGGGLALGVACALALALGTWLQAWIACLGVLSLSLLPALLGLGPLPGARVAALLSGEVPPAIRVTEAAALTLVGVVALLLASSQRGRRRTA